MKRIFYAFITIFIVSLFSCGPSAEEKAAAEKAKMDSIANATKLKMEMKYAYQDSIKMASSDIDLLETRLTETKANYEVAKDEMTRIKEFQLGRLPSERDQQIKDQIYKIDDLEKSIQNYKDVIVKLKQKIKEFENELKKFE